LKLPVIPAYPRVFRPSACFDVSFAGGRLEAEVSQGCDAAYADNDGGKVQALSQCFIRL
jgi:hypothetical protein